MSLRARRHGIVRKPPGTPTAANVPIAATIAVAGTATGTADRATTVTINTAAGTIQNLPAQPGVVAYGWPFISSVMPQYAHPGAMIAPGRDVYDDQSVIDAAAAGATVLIYFDVVVWNTIGRYHDRLFNASPEGAAVPKWPGPVNANSTGDLVDFRVGGVMHSGKLEAVLELMVSENPHMGGIFMDDVGSRSWFPNFNWDTWGTTNQQAYRDGAIAICQTVRTVCDRHGLVFIVNGTWTAGTLATSGGGYPTMTTHGCSLAEGGVVEHHDGSSSFFGPYMDDASQWGNASPITGGKPFCFAICDTAAGVTEYRNDGRASWVTQQPSSDYGGVAPWGTAADFHPTGLPHGVGGGAATVPGTPSAPSVVAGDTTVTVSWAAPSSGGSVITGYDVLNNNTSGVTSVGVVTSTVLTGLTNGVGYTFQVRAVNAIGNGGYSARSVTVTPTAAPAVAWGSSSPTTNYVGGGGATSAVVTAPTGIVTNNLLVACLHMEANPPPTVTLPTGWTQIASTSGAAGMGAVIAWKRAGGSEPSSYTFTWTGGVWTTAVIHRFTGAVTAGNPFGSAAGYASAYSTSTTIPSQAYTASGAGLGIWVCTTFSDGSTITPPAGYTQQYTATPGSQTLGTRADAAGSPTSGTGTASSNGGAEVVFAGVLLA
jgi:hypothetical protein